mgnify:CR=1 FL=1
MIVEITEAQAEEILVAEDYLWNGGFPAGSQFLLAQIKEAFPALWAKYGHLEQIQ